MLRPQPLDTFSTVSDPLRVEALARYDILDTQPEQAFDAISALLSSVCQTPVAYISLVDETRQFFKSEVGLIQRGGPVDALARLVVGTGAPGVIVEDLRADPRLANEPRPAYRPEARFFAARPLRTAEGHAIGFVAVIDDRPRKLNKIQHDALATLGQQALALLDLRLARQGLKQSEEQFAAAFERAGLGIVVADSAGRVIRANQSFCKLIGLEEAEIIGKDSSRYTHPDDQVFRAQMIEDLASSAGPARSYEKRYIHASGRSISTQVTLAPIYDDRGRLASLIGVVEDVTQRKQTHRELAEARRRSEAAMIAAEVGTFTWDVSADRVYGDANFSRIFPITLDSAGGAPAQAYFDVIHPDDRSRIVAALKSFLLTGDHYESEHRVLSGTQTRWVSARGKVERDARGEPIRMLGVVLDISARKQAQEALAQNTASANRERRMFDAVLSNTPDLGYVFDLQHRFIYANTALLKMWGKTQEEALGRTCLELGYEPWHAEMHDREIEQVIATRQMVRGEVPFTGTGGRRVYDYILAPVFSAEGEVVAVAGTTRDVTERTVGEERDRFLVRLDDRTYALTDPQEITRTAAHLLGEHLQVNRCAYADVEPDGNFFNLTGDYNSGVQSIVGRYRFSDFGAECLRLMRAGKPFTVEDSESDPRTRAVAESFRFTSIRSVVCVPVKKADRLVAAMAVHQNTPRKWTPDEIDLVQHVAYRCWEAIERARVTRDLRDSEERYRILTQTVSAVIWVVDQAGMMTPDNRSWSVFTGQTAEQYRDRGWLDALHSDDRARTEESLDRSLKNQVPYQGEYRLLRYDGQFRQVVARGAPVFTADGMVREWVGNCIDVTDPRRAAEEREQLLESERAARNEAERASRLKDDFLATLSHELRTPLNAIFGWAQILQQGERTDEDLSQGIEAIERNARVQIQLIEDLLDMSRIMSGKLRLDVKSVNLVDVLEQAISAVLPSTQAKQLRLERDIESNQATVLGDPARLQQVVWNLLTNAVKFTPTLGTITVKLKRLASNVELAIRDSGQGIRADFLPHVFERFRQADSSTARQHGGLGLGLALVKQITEMHGGSVSAGSDGEGQGATFTVTLPAELPDRVRAPESACAGRTTATAAVGLQCDLSLLKVLVVDDEADARALVSRLLQDCGARVCLASDAQEALRLVQEEQPDIIISDIGMPGEDGYSFIKRVRRLPVGAGGRIPAAALTAFARSEDRRRALLAGFQSHLTKPLDRGELLAVVSSLAGRVQPSQS